MSKYDVIALGNALVDKEYEVTDEFLAAQGVEKGVMTLLECDVQQRLLDSLNNQFGLKKRAGGGSAANSMVTTAQFGGKVFYCCKVGDDALGEFYLKDLTDAGVMHRLDQQNTPGATGRCVVMVSQDAERTMCTYLGITIDFSVNELHEDVIRNAQILYIEGHLVYQREAVDAILVAKKIAREAGIKVAMTFSDPAVVKYARDHLADVIGEDGVDLLFCNQDEVADWAGNDDVDAGIEDLLKICPTLVLTRGSKGAQIITRESVIDIPPYPVKAVDSTGAGDTFAGAFLYGITNGLDMATAGRLASRSAAECVSQFGPRLAADVQQTILAEVLGEAQ
ncbi:adenosine kinase [Bowmanella sp. JS7-9]|uniref:Adenosine kinase n=1 Tax=Pseudobowmanella zhangzhouensis TaxID=1537679 RepID=A0ABW1XM20_9ALTE|nr:adenosine kinase [Bowmanella sp. JS7-9]TBX21821.1 sugar kinase [Bowmanella sp. JS7-9]